MHYDEPRKSELVPTGQQGEILPRQADNDPQLIELWLHGRSKHTQRIPRVLDRDDLSIQDVAEMAGTSVQQIERTYKTVGRRHKKLASLADKVHGNSRNIE